MATPCNQSAHSIALAERIRIASDYLREYSPHISDLSFAEFFSLNNVEGEREFYTVKLDRATNEITVTMTDYDFTKYPVLL